MTLSPGLYEPDCGLTSPPSVGEAVTFKVYFTIGGGVSATSLSLEHVVSIINNDNKSNLFTTINLAKTLAITSNSNL